MVNAKSAAASQLTSNPIVPVAKAARVKPKPAASPGAMRPRGIGRPAVRDITASMSASYHMLSTPAERAPTAMHKSAVKPITGCTWPGAIIRPTSAVNTTSDITRGFISST